MTRRLTVAIGLVLLLGAGQPASTAEAQGRPESQAPESQAFRTLLDDHWSYVLNENPVLATSLGVRRLDGRLGDQSVAAMDRQKASLEALIARAEAIDPARLSAAERVNRAILIRDMKTERDGLAFGQRLMLFTTYSAWHTQFAGLPDAVPFFTRADYDSYLGRLAEYPRLNAEGIATTRAALSGGFVQPCAAMAEFEKTIEAHIVDDVSQSVFMRPFGRQPDSIDDAAWADLKGRALLLVRDKVIPAYRDFLDFYTREYAPRCRQSVGVSALPQGADYYLYRARAMTTTELTPDQIHRIGLDEVARIQKEMDKVAFAAGFASRQTYARYLREEPRFYARSPDELLMYAAALAKRIDGELPRLFGRLPRLPYTVKPIPADQAEGTTTAYYEPGAGSAGRAGVYRVNTSHLDQRPLYELPSLTVHEAVPGHHLQIALQQELNLPDFRKYTSFFTAFVEGWALYAETLGHDMGLYDKPETQFGRLSYEMWRACRLVVDTGLHAKGWTKQQAIDFMTANTALSPHNIEAEVNRYITWPGQALAYKIGELRIRALKARAQAALGPAFDLRAFHDAVLENGAVPLDVLEAHVDGWIAGRKQGQQQEAAS